MIALLFLFILGGAHTASEYVRGVVALLLLPFVVIAPFVLFVYFPLLLWRAALRWMGRAWRGE